MDIANRTARLKGFEKTKTEFEHAHLEAANAEPSRRTSTRKAPQDIGA